MHKSNFFLVVPVITICAFYNPAWAYSYTPPGGGEYTVMSPRGSSRSFEVVPYCVKYKWSLLLKIKWSATEMKEGGGLSDCDEKIGYVKRYDSIGRRQVDKLTFMLLFDSVSNKYSLLDKDYSPARSIFYRDSNGNVSGLKESLFDDAIRSTGIIENSRRDFYGDDVPKKTAGTLGKESVIMQETRERLSGMGEEEILNIGEYTDLDDVNKLISESKISILTRRIGVTSDLKELNSILEKYQHIIPVAQLAVLNEKIRSIEVERELLIEKKKSEEEKSRKKAAYERYLAEYNFVINEKNPSARIKMAAAFVGRYRGSDPRKFVEQINLLMPEMRVAAYRHEFKNLKDSASMAAFIENYKNDDFDKLIPGVSSRMAAARKNEEVARKNALLKSIEDKIKANKQLFYQYTMNLIKEKEISAMSGVVNMERQYRLAQSIQFVRESTDRLYSQYKENGGTKDLSSM